MGVRIRWRLSGTNLGGSVTCRQVTDFVAPWFFVLTSCDGRAQAVLVVRCRQGSGLRCRKLDLRKEGVPCLPLGTTAGCEGHMVARPGSLGVYVWPWA